MGLKLFVPSKPTLQTQTYVIKKCTEHHLMAMFESFLNFLQNRCLEKSQLAIYCWISNWAVLFVIRCDECS